MIKPRLLLSLGLVWWTTGCTLMPDFPLPDPPIPSEWPGWSEMASEAEIPHPPPWRIFYSEPSLQKVIEAALSSSRDLQAASARMEKARALLEMAGAARLPALHGHLSQQAVRTPADLSPGGSTSIARSAEMGITLPAFELDFWGRLQSLEAASRATYLASGETILALRVVLIAQVVEAWLSWRSLSEQVFIAEERMKSHQALSWLAAEREKAGVATAQSTWQAKIEVERARADLADLQRQVLLAQNALQLLTGESLDPAKPWPALQALELGVAMQRVLPAQILATRPDVRAAEHRLTAANANIGVARAAFWPRIALTTALGTASQGLSGLFQAGSSRWLFMPQLDLPIFDFSRRQYEQAAVEAERNALLAEYEKVLQQAFREVADGLTSRGAWTARLKAATATRGAQKARWDLIQSRFRAGLDGKQAVLEAQLALYASEQEVRRAQQQVLLNQVTLYKALGGGAE